MFYTAVGAPVNSVSQMIDLKQNIPTYLPLVDAAKKFGLPQKVLIQLVQAVDVQIKIHAFDAIFTLAKVGKTTKHYLKDYGKIEAVQLPSGELLVAVENNGSENKTKAS